MDGRPEGGREGEINPQLYGNEVLPPFCQRPARQARASAAWVTWGATRGPLLSQRACPRSVPSPLRALLGGIRKAGGLGHLEEKAARGGHAPAKLLSPWRPALARDVLRAHTPEVSPGRPRGTVGNTTQPRRESVRESHGHRRPGLLWAEEQARNRGRHQKRIKNFSRSPLQKPGGTNSGSAEAGQPWRGSVPSSPAAPRVRVGEEINREAQRHRPGALLSRPRKQVGRRNVSPLMNSEFCSDPPGQIPALPAAASTVKIKSDANSFGTK